MFESEKSVGECIDMDKELIMVLGHFAETDNELVQRNALHVYKLFQISCF